MPFIKFLNDNIFWGPPMVVFLIATAVFLSFITKGLLFRRFGTVLRFTLLSLFKSRKKAAEEGAITPFQAVCTALAGTVGTGNIIGVALAISVGGPGSLFWIWISALGGMVLKYCEVTLAVAFRQKNHRGELVGGPMHYIERGLKLKPLAKCFALFGLLASFGIGAAVQANSLSLGIRSVFSVPSPVIGLAVSLTAAAVLIGGVKRIASVTEILVPFMAAFYILGAIAVILLNAKELPRAFFEIFRGAFCGTAPAGGFLGAGVMTACKIGMARGVFTHEAGMGSAPIAHASAFTDHPAKQGFWGAIEVFLDSIIICTLTGLVIIISRLWRADPPMSGGEMSAAAFGEAFSGGQYIVTAGLILFAFATVIAWYYYGEKCAEYLCGGGHAIGIYRLTYILFVFLGTILSLDAVWGLADLFNGLMTIPNLLALIMLSPVIGRITRDFFDRL